MTAQSGIRAAQRGAGPKGQAVAGAMLPAFLCAFLGTPGCDSAHTKPLPRLEAPAGLSEAEQVTLLYAQLGQYFRYAREGVGMRFDEEDHVFAHAGAATLQLQSWRNRIPGFKGYTREAGQAMLERTPESARFRGARKRAVALGLYALSLWRQDPPPRTPTVQELSRCGVISSPRCDHEHRTLALQRMILMGQHADRALFKRLSKPVSPQ